MFYPEKYAECMQASGNANRMREKQGKIPLRNLYSAVLQEHVRSWYTYVIGVLDQAAACGGQILGRFG